MVEGIARATLIYKIRDHRIHITQHITRCNAYRGIAVTFQPRIPSDILIIARRTIMRYAIYFDGNLGRHTYKIENIDACRMLPPEFIPVRPGFKLLP